MRLKYSTDSQSIMKDLMITKYRSYKVTLPHDLTSLEFIKTSQSNGKVSVSDGTDS